ncbi:MAG: lipid-A-disaccharide synthase [Armatimonadota bacterium]|nr:MAG: lipid-A-disaccharide synthase [Armatimonadota bacterium]
MSTSITIACVAGEVSGDASCAALVQAVHQRLPDVRFWGIGGRRMAEAGVQLLYDSTRWGAVGVVEALRLAPALWLAQQNLKRRLAQQPPHLLVLVDFGAFNVPLAKWAKQRGIRVFYYFPPGSWRRYLPRRNDLPYCTDCIVTPFPWSAELLRQAGANAHFVGHPLLDRVRPSLSDEEFCARLNLNPERLRIGLLPGSRRQEVRALLPTMRKAAELLSDLEPGAQFVMAIAPSVQEEEVRRAFAGSVVRWQVAREMTYDVMAYSHLLWCCSGTATLEAAILGTPMIILYRGSWLMEMEYHLRKRSLNLTFIGLPNLIAQRSICPELLQHDATPQNIVAYSLTLLPGTEGHRLQREALQEVKSVLGEPGATERTARLLLECVDVHHVNTR